MNMLPRWVLGRRMCSCNRVENLVDPKPENLKPGFRVLNEICFALRVTTQNCACDQATPKLPPAQKISVVLLQFLAAGFGFLSQQP